MPLHDVQSTSAWTRPAPPLDANPTRTERSLVMAEELPELQLDATARRGDTENARIARDVNTGAALLTAAENSRARRASDSRRAPAPHSRKREWQRWASEKAFAMSQANPDLSSAEIASKMSDILSGAQGGEPCTVPSSTVRTWLSRKRKQADLEVEDVREGADAFVTAGEVAAEMDAEASRGTPSTRTGRPAKLHAMHKRLVLGWRSQFPEATAKGLSEMLIYHMREVCQPPVPNFFVSASSVRRLLRDSRYVWKMSRPSRAVVFSKATAVASVRFSHAIQRLLLLSGANENTERFLFGDETTFSTAKVPAMIWAEKGLPARYVGNKGKGGVSVLVIINAAGNIVYVHGNIGTSNWEHSHKQLTHAVEVFDEQLGEFSGFLMTIDNAKWHHKALAKLCDRWEYYPPSTAEMAQTFADSVPVEALDASTNNGSSSRAQFYVLREPSFVGADDGRYFIMTPAGMASFQPCETLFASLKERMGRLPASVSNATQVKRTHCLAIETLLLTTPKAVVKGCVRSAEHYRRAWLVRAQVASQGGDALTLHAVEQVVLEHRREMRQANTRNRRDIGTYTSELDILRTMLNEYAGSLRIKFKTGEGSDSSMETVLADGDIGGEMDGGSIVLVDPDGFKGTELMCKEKFLDQEQAQQNPSFTWETMPTARQQTVAALNREKAALKNVLELERRSREYFVQRQVLNQASRVQRAAGSVGEQD